MKISIHTLNENALYNATKNKHYDMVKFLLSRGATLYKRILEQAVIDNSDDIILLFTMDFCNKNIKKTEYNELKTLLDETLQKIQC